MTTTTRIAPLALLLVTALIGCQSEVEVLGDGSHGAGNGGGNSTSGDPDQPSGPACDPTWMHITGFYGGPISFKGMCMDQPAQITPSGDADCFVIDLRLPGESCDCDPAKGVKPLDPSHAWAIDEAKVKLPANEKDWACFCEISQISGDPDDAAACLNTPGSPVGSDGQPLNGFCYVDPGLTPPRGSAEIAAVCPTDSQHMLRFVGAPPVVAPTDHRLFLFVCQTDACKSP